MSPRLASILLPGAALLAAVLLLDRGGLAQTVDPPVPAPDFTQQQEIHWLNSRPLSLAQLRGRVVLVNFWTFNCWNSYRSFPWLKTLIDRYEARGLTVVGVHTPEFEAEKSKKALTAKINEFGLTHPVMIDNDYVYWNTLGNRYWPAFYLLDREGRIRAWFAGETHRGDRQAKAIEAAVERLLAEPAG